jgi:hypothetical protein
MRNLLPIPIRQGFIPQTPTRFGSASAQRRASHEPFCTAIATTEPENLTRLLINFGFLDHHPSPVSVSRFVYVSVSWHSFLSFLVARPANEASTALTFGEGQVGLNEAFGPAFLV